MPKTKRPCPTGEPSSKLDDDSELTLRTVVVSVARAVDQYNEEGQPLYIVKSQTIVDATAPKELRRKK